MASWTVVGCRFLCAVCIRPFAVAKRMFVIVNCCSAYLREFGLLASLDCAGVRGKQLERSDIVARFHALGFISDLDLELPGALGARDPFADAEAKGSGAGSREYTHVRLQQRNGKQSLTTVQGLRKELNYTKSLRDFKKELCCNGTVVQDCELGKVIQLQGDQRKNVSQFLVQTTGADDFHVSARKAGVVKKEFIKIHGF